MNRLAPLEIQDLLDNLVERSLIICDPLTGRYTMSESMRVYASDQLADEQPKMQQAHFEYFFSKAEEMFRFSRAHEDTKAMMLLRPEVDNLRQAFEWAVVNDPERCLHFIRCLGPAWYRMSRIEAEPLSVRALAAVPEKADEDHIAVRMQLARGKLRQLLMDEARSLLAIALRQANEIDVDPNLFTYLIMTVAVMEFYAGNNELARERTIESLNLAKKHQLPGHEASANINLGEMSRAAGDFAAAKQYYEEGLRLSSGDPFSDSLVLFNLGCTALELDDAAEAEEYFRRALGAHAFAGIEIANAPLGGLGYVCVLKGRYREAGLLMGYPEARRQKQKGRMDPVDERMFEHYRKLGSQLGGAEFDRAFAEGAHLTADDLERIVRETGE